MRGVLKDARFNSPSHAVVVTPGAERTTIELAAGAAMDRDFVLEARSARSGAAEALLAPDGDGWVVLASVCPDIPDFATDERRSIKIVVDCSGSMNGDSIAQVRVAAERILDSLRTGDRFEFIAFGSSRCALFGRTMPASEENLADARRFVRGLTADMGGTEIGDAPAAAYRTPDDAGASRDLLLITDGEVWDTASVVGAARASGHHIFTVGVGSAVAEPFVRAVAAATGGSCELVTPREDMAERIHRHFQRIAAPRARTARVRWPAPVERRIPQRLPPLYGGDTVHLFAWFADKPHGAVVLDLQLSDGRTINQRLQINPVPHAAVPAAPSLDDLQARGIPAAIIRRLEALIDAGEDTRVVIDAFLYLVGSSEAGLGLNRPQRRRLLRAYKDLSEPGVAEGRVRNIWRTWSGAA